MPEVTLKIDEAALLLVMVVLRLNGKPNATVDDAVEQVKAAIKSMKETEQ